MSGQTIHRPDLVSGLIRGVMGLCVGKWESGERLELS